MKITMKILLVLLLLFSENSRPKGGVALRLENGKQTEQGVSYEN